MSADVHCQNCGAITRQVTQDDGTEVLVCTDDNCPQVVVMVLTVPGGYEVASDD